MLSQDAVLEAIISSWKPLWSGAALQRELGPDGCARVRAWLLQHADTTLWPVIKVREQTKPVGHRPSHSPRTGKLHAAPLWGC